MNRRSFLVRSAAAVVALALQGGSAGMVSGAYPDDLHIQDGRIASGDGLLKVDFGPGLQVTSLSQSDGIWYAGFTSGAQPSQQFVLKSYNGRIWGSLDWQPRHGSPALS